MSYPRKMLRIFRGGMVSPIASLGSEMKGAWTEVGP